MITSVFPSYPSSLKFAVPPYSSLWVLHILTGSSPSPCPTSTQELGRSIATHCSESIGGGEKGGYDGPSGHKASYGQRNPSLIRVLQYSRDISYVWNFQSAKRCCFI